MLNQIMIEKSILFEILREQNFWYKLPEYDYVNRETYINSIKNHLTTKSILIIQGPRRTGKTVLLKLIIQDMIKTIDKDQILYVNLEDYRLFRYYSLDLLEKIYAVYRENVNPKNKVYFFIDEIQNIEEFEHFLRTKYDEAENIKFIITGSNSKLLSKELATLLTGRTLTFEIFPFSFIEYLQFKKEIITDYSYYSLEPKKYDLKHFFNIFLTTGSIPEYIDNPAKERLEEYFENVILKDIVERFRIRNTKLIKELGIYLLSNVSNITSYSSMKRTFNISINTVKEYLSYLESAYLFFTLNKFSYSYKNHITSPSKVYCVDNGLVNLVSFKFSENKGKLYENLVFLELKRNDYEIYYHGAKSECDFIVKKQLKVIDAIQVAVSLNEEKTKNREIDGLIEALNQYDLKEGLILTEEDYTDLVVKNFKIKIRPLWFWLLNKND